MNFKNLIKFSLGGFLGVLIKETIKLGAVPFYFYNDASFEKSLIDGADKQQIEAYTAIHRHLMEDADCYVAGRGDEDVFALSDVKAESMDMFGKIFQEQVHMRTRLPKTRWCVMRWPNTSMAAMSRMSLKQFEDFYFEACLLDYRKMGKAMLPLKKLMDKTENMQYLHKPAEILHINWSVQAKLFPHRRNLCIRRCIQPILI